ncbi:MAG: thiolase-like protein [Monoraphidium minutum]|nr:MAG: thiolase-like protein [Monoraphidium minutum]
MSALVPSAMLQACLHVARVAGATALARAAGAAGDAAAARAAAAGQRPAPAGGSALVAAGRPRAYSSSAPPDPFGSPPPLPQRRVVVTGVGVVCPVGVGAAAAWAALVAGRTGTSALRPEDLPESQRAAFDTLPSRVIGAVPRGALRASPHFDGANARRNAPFMELALCAAAEALADAGWAPSTPEQRAATGVCIGAGIGCTADTADAGALVSAGRMRRVSPFFVPRILVNMAAGAVSIKYGLQGPNSAPSTACATGVHAVGDAFRAVQRGDADVMVAGAAEAAIDAIGLAGFSRLKALSTAYNATPGAASRPFDAGRDGFVMGEGAGVLVLEELGHARARGARAYAEVRGYGMSGDGHHITAPHPSGAGAALAMSRALAGSGVPAAAVRYINAHATSTPVGDDIEQRAIMGLFGPALAARLAVSSTKGATGHLLGAAGAVEAAFTVLALRARAAPPTANLEAPDPALLPLLVRGAALPLGDGPLAALCNSFGFGGTNASLLFATPPEE